MSIKMTGSFGKIQGQMKVTLGGSLAAWGTKASQFDSSTTATELQATSNPDRQMAEMNKVISTGTKVVYEIEVLHRTNMTFGFGLKSPDPTVAITSKPSNLSSPTFTAAFADIIFTSGYAAGQFSNAYTTANGSYHPGVGSMSSVPGDTAGVTVDRVNNTMTIDKNGTPFLTVGLGAFTGDMIPFVAVTATGDFNTPLLRIRGGNTNPILNTTVPAGFTLYDDL